MIFEHHDRNPYEFMFFDEEHIVFLRYRVAETKVRDAYSRRTFTTDP